MITHETIEGCKRNSHNAQRKLFDSYSREMFNVCSRYLKLDEDVEDVLSRGFTKVFNSIVQFEYRENNSLKAWIKRIMINECLMDLRKKSSLTLVSEDEAEEVGFNDPGFEKIDAVYIIEAIKSLPAGYSTVLNLFAIEGYSHAEISEMLGISEGTSRSQLNKARRLMKQKLYKKVENHGRRKI